MVVTEQLSELVYVIEAVPSATPVTTPDELTVAILGFELTHVEVEAPVPLPVKVMVDPSQTDMEPEIVGTAFTVTVCVAVQPFEFVYVIVAVPAELPVTTPLASTVATVASEVVHGLVVAEVPEPDSVIVEDSHTEDKPVMEGTSIVTVDLSVNSTAQFPLVTYTLYEVVAVGETLKVISPPVPVTAEPTLLSSESSRNW